MQEEDSVNEMLPIRGLTQIQPWATLIATEQKPIETRTKRSHFRGWLLIHAGKKWGPEEVAVTGNLIIAGADLDEHPPLGFVLAVARLARCAPFMDTHAEIRRATSVRIRNHHGMDSPCLEAPLPTDFNFRGLTGDTRVPIRGLWSWHLEDVIALPDPIPWVGSQGLWIPRGPGVQNVAGQLADLAHPAAGAFAALK